MVTMLDNQRRIRWSLLLTLLMTFLAAGLSGQSVKANTISEPKGQIGQSSPEPVPLPVVGPKAEKSTPATPEQERMEQIEADTKRLYQLSAELRAEVARTYKESLSLTVLKKAGEVESLAKSLKVLLNREAEANR